MNEENVVNIMLEFERSGKNEYKESFKSDGHPEYIFNILIEKKVRLPEEEGKIYDDIAMEDFVSALPSGLNCPRCNGSGKL